jgi:VWFA-related protein
MPMITISIRMQKTLRTLWRYCWLSALTSVLLKAAYPQDKLDGHSYSSQATPAYTYRSGVSEVRLLFFAADKQNRVVDGLKRTDFAVLDNSWVVRDFRSLTRSGSVHLDVILLVDCSASVLPRFDREFRNAMNLVSQPGWRPEDNLSVLVFGGREVNLVCDGNCGNWFTSEHMAALPSGGATPLFDAVIAATDVLAQRRQFGRLPVIVVFSDGNDTISVASLHDAWKKIVASEELVYAVDVSGDSENSNGNSALRKMADDSGGRYLSLSEDPAELLKGIIGDLQSGLVVSYSVPETTAGFHSLRILPTHNLNLQFRSRRGYFYQAARPRQETLP